jgi:hypothetical protein
VRPEGYHNPPVHPASFLTRKWRLSARGNRYLTLQGITLVVFKARGGPGYERWYYQVAGEYGPDGYATEREAKLAAFDAFGAALSRRAAGSPAA